MEATGWNELRARWKILLATVTGSGLGSSGLWFYTQGIFFGPVSQAFDVSISQITIAGLYAIPLAIGIAYPFGRLVDRLGTRRVSMFGIPLFALCVAACGLYSGPFWGFQAIIVAQTALGLGAGPAVYTRIASANFDQARGKALGFTLAGLGLAAFLLPTPLTLVIESAGYRMGYLALAALALLALPVVLLLVPRDRADAGRDAHNADRENVAGKETTGWDAGPAMRSPTYLLMILLFVVSCIATTMIFIPLATMLQHFGESPVWAATAVSIGGIGLIIGRAGNGVLMDRFFPTLIAAVLFPVTAAAVALLLVPGPSWLWLISAFFAGLALGAEGDMVAMLVTTYFGIRPYATLYAVGYAFFGPTAAYIGPHLASAQFEGLGSYVPVVLTSMVFFAIATVLALLLPRRTIEPRGHRAKASTDSSDTVLA